MATGGLPLPDLFLMPATWKPHWRLLGGGRGACKGSGEGEASGERVAWQLDVQLVVLWTGCNDLVQDDQ